MSIGRRMTPLVLLAILGLTAPSASRASFNLNGNFGPNGDIGYPNSPNLQVTFGTDSLGSISQMNGFINVPSLNGGMSTSLDSALPPGLGYSFSATNLPSANQLVLTYSFYNNTGAALNGFQFLYYVDPDIGANPADNVVSNSSSTPPGLPGPTTFQAGDNQLSSIYFNTLLGQLNNTNSIGTSTPGDASMALGFNLGNLGVNQSVLVEILLSDNGTSIGNFSLTQSDDPNTAGHSATSITISGAVIVPEPSSLTLVAIGALSGLGLSVGRRSRAGQAWTRSQ